MFTQTLSSLGVFGTNAYLIWDDQRRGVLIDAPDNAGYILKKAAEKDISINKILLTHGHCDHIAAAAEISANTGADIYIHSADRDKLWDDNANLTDYFGLPPTVHPDPDKVKTVEDGDVVAEGDLEFEVLCTPGHTSGSVCYIIEDRMYCGDTIFKDSMGRTDMPDGDEDTLFDSLAMLYEFDIRTDYIMLPGHGPSTRISDERMSNRYLLYAYKTADERHSGETT